MAVSSQPGRDGLSRCVSRYSVPSPRTTSPAVSVRIELIQLFGQGADGLEPRQRREPFREPEWILGSHGNQQSVPATFW